MLFVLEQSEIEFKLEHLTDCVLTGVAVAWDIDALFTVASSLHSFNYEDKFNVFLKINDHFQLPGHRLWNYCGIYVEYLWLKLIFKGSPWIYYYCKCWTLCVLLLLFNSIHCRHICTTNNIFAPKCQNSVNLQILFVHPLVPISHYIWLSNYFEFFAIAIERNAVKSKTMICNFWREIVFSLWHN